MSILDQVKEHRKHIRYEQVASTMSEIINMYSAQPQEVIIKPDFQRLFRWSREQQSNFIESILLEIPIPPLFFYENDQGVWELLDGLQRVSTLIRFMNPTEVVPDNAQGEAGNENEWHYENENQLSTPLQLLPGDYLTNMVGLTFKSLPMQLQLNFKRARLHIFVLKRETDRQYKYEVFKRINKGGSTLKDQEVRNCSVRLLDDVFPQYIQSIAKTEPFVASLGLSDEQIRSGYAEELALRFFAMKNNYSEFRHDVDIFLDKYMERVAKKELSFDFDNEKKIFEMTFKIINDAMTDGEAFKGKNQQNHSIGPFSPALFEAVAIGVSINVDSLKSSDSKDIRDKIISLIKDVKSKNYSGAGSNSKVKTHGRISLGKKWFSS